MKVALMWPKHGNGGENPEVELEEKRKGAVGSDPGRADRYLINTAQCPRYGQMYFRGSCTYRQTALCIL